MPKNGVNWPGGDSRSCIEKCGPGNGIIQLKRMFRDVGIIKSVKRIVSSGGIVIKWGKGGNPLVLLVKHENGGLVFPKGHVVSGETHEQAALREVREETGLRNLSIVGKIGVVTRLSIEDSGEKVEKKIHLYLMTTDNYEHGEADEDYGWFSFNEAIKGLKFKREKEFLEKFWDKILKLGVGQVLSRESS